MHFEITVPRSGVKVLRRQYPLKSCYAITFCKAQGQTLGRMVLDARIPSVTHGQLYCALRRVRSIADLIMVVGGENVIEIDGRNAICVENVVWPELLEAVLGEQTEKDDALSPKRRRKVRRAVAESDGVHHACLEVRDRYCQFFVYRALGKQNFGMRLKARGGNN